MSVMINGTKAMLDKKLLTLDLSTTLLYLEVSESVTQ